MREEKRLSRGVRGKVVRRRGGGERRAGWRSTRRGLRDRGQGAAGGRPDAARSGLSALRAARAPEPRALSPAWRTYFPAQTEAVVAPETRDIRAEGSPLRHRSKLAEVWQLRCCPPLPPHPPPPPKRLSHHPGGGGSSPLPRAHSAAAAAGVHAHSALEPPRLLGGRRPATSPPARPASPGTRERQHAAVPQTGSAPAPLGGRRGPALPIGPALILNEPIGAAVSGRHGDRCCSEQEG